MLTSVPRGKADRARLKGESRIRVATRMLDAKQELAIENVWNKTVRAITRNSPQAQINKLSRPKQEITRPFKLECHGILRDPGPTQKSAGVTED
jgi:hypothetical protein